MYIYLYISLSLSLYIYIYIITYIESDIYIYYNISIPWGDDGWAQRLFGSSSVLPRRQDLPREAFWEQAELFERMPLVGSRRVKIVAVSWEWPATSEPNTTSGERLRMLGRVIDVWLGGPARCGTREPWPQGLF